MRARDVDRVAVREALDAAFTDGQLGHAEHRRRTEAAQSARTLDDLDRLVRDLQSPPTSIVTTAPMSPSSSTRWITTFATAVVLICGIVAVASGHDVAPASSGTSVDLTTAAGFGRMLDDIHRNLGNSEVDRLTIHPGYASISRPAPGAAGSEQSYRYENGQLTDAGRSPGRTAGVPVDLRELRPNTERLIGLLHGADRTLGVSDPSGVYLIAERDDDNGPVVSIYLSNEDSGAQGFMTVGFDGEVLEIRRADR